MLKDWVLPILFFSIVIFLSTKGGLRTIEWSFGRSSRRFGVLFAALAVVILLAYLFLP